MEVSLPLVALPKPYVKLPQRQSGGDFLYPRNVMRYMDRHLESSDQCAFGFSIQKTLIVYDLSKIPYYAPGIGPESLIYIHDTVSKAVDLNPTGAIVLD